MSTPTDDTPDNAPNAACAVGHGSIAFRQYGASGPRVLFVMGLGMRGAAWERQVEHFEADHQVVVFDNRGVGQSDPSPGWFRISDMADDAKALLDHLAWERVHLVGVSMGGMIAQMLAPSISDRLASLTLIATASGPSWRFVNAPKIVPAFARGLVDRRFTGEHRVLYSREFLQVTPRSNLDGRTERVSEQRQSRRIRQLGAAALHDARPHLNGITVPTLVVSPTADNLIRPAACRRLAKQIPGATLVEIEGAGHGAIYERPAPINAALRAHIAAVENAP